MSSSEGSDLSRKFKSKKPLTQNLKSIDPKPQPDPMMMMAPTPEKKQVAPPRPRSRNVVCSLKGVRAAAKSVGERKEPFGSVRKQIFPDEKPEPEPEKLPEKFEMLDMFFKYMDSSIKLLKNKDMKTSFANICPKVQELTDRRFTYNHLAQLKFILPEVIEIKKVPVLDDRTGGCKFDLRVSLNIAALEDYGKSKSGSAGIVRVKKRLDVRDVFRNRLVEISRSHPEDYEIPEATLPHPFNCRKQDIHSNAVKSSSSFSPGEVSTGSLQGHETHHISSNQSMEDLNFNIIRTSSISFPVKASCEVPKNQQPDIASHLSRSCRRHFSQKAKRSESENIQDDPPKATLRPSNLSVSESKLDTVCSLKEDGIAASSHSQVLNTIYSIKEDSIAVPCDGEVPATPTKKIEPSEDDGLPGNDTAIQSAPGKLALTPANLASTPAELTSTPAKLVSTPARLMSVTPAPHPPKRCIMSPEDSLPNKLARHPPRPRSLKFGTPVKNRNVEAEVLDMDDASIDKDVLDILPEHLLQSLKDKEKKATEERTPAISQAKRRQKMITNLPKLFNMIHFLVQSMNCSFITKQELVHKIIWNQSGMIDRKDVEEQFDLLLELVPDWISEKKLGGDLVFKINKGSCPEAIRCRLEEAI